MGLLFRYNLLSIFARKTSTVSSIAMIAIVIAVFAYLQAVTDSAFSTMSGTGDAGTVLIMSQQAETEGTSTLSKDQINKLDGTPGISRSAAGPTISPELCGFVSLHPRNTSDEDPGLVGSVQRLFSRGGMAKELSERDAEEVRVNAGLRGVDFDLANAARRNRVKIQPGGRAFTAGTFECIVGESAHRTFRVEIGDEIQLGTRGRRMFKVVGIFDTGGTAADSEVWAYVETLRDVYGGRPYSSARVLVADESAARAAIDYVTGPAVELGAKTERDYFANLNTGQTATRILGVAMIIIMGAAAAFAIANTMYAAVAGRTREIGTLRALGFSRALILASFVLEGLMLAVIGGVLGCLASFAFHGAQRNMLPSTFTTVSYSLKITPQTVVFSLAAAAVIGLLGSILPASRAARISVVQALREA